MERLGRCVGQGHDEDDVASDTGAVFLTVYTG
jgi:hypothetical protein